ncbi:MAG: A/G-specific adenine glycosylase [Anaerostipes sp.]|nr:A/G-specific adenine glycosylase [Anaerostipes sp.]
MNKEQEMGASLLHWYDFNARILPWRADKNPYRIWISEIMLQQTRVEAVKPYFDRFMKELPDVNALASVDDDKLMKLWEGLGYYNRARNLKIAANEILENYNGKIPASYDELISLKGIGMYTAGAIASIAFDVSVPAVDGNVLRVMARVLGDDSDILKDKTKKEMAKKIIPMISADRPGDFNQALIELGATVCIPNGEPLCHQCPWDTVCKAYKEDLTGLLPVKTKKKERRIEHKIVFIFETKDQILIHKRGKKGLLAGLWEFPNVEGTGIEEEIKDYLKKYELEDARYEFTHNGIHIFSHIEWHMKGVKIFLENPKPMKDMIWIPKKDLERIYAIPSAFELFRNSVKN